MKYDFLILSSEKTEDTALQLCKDLSEKGAKCITNVDPKQRAKSLFEAVSASGKVLVLVPSEIDLEEDEQFLELIDGAYVEGTEINSVYISGNEIPEQLLLYLGRRDAIDLEEAKDFNMESLKEHKISQQNSFNASVQNQDTEVISGNIGSNENSIDIEEKNEQIREFLANADNVLYGQIQLNEDEAKEFMSTLTEVADTGNIDAIYWHGRFYRKGIIVEEDLEKATTLFETAANQEHPDAKAELGLLHLNGKIRRKNKITGEIIVEAPNMEKGIQLLNEALNLGHYWAPYFLGSIYDPNPECDTFRHEWKININPDLNRAIDYYKKGAEVNNCQCIYALGNAYLQGKGVFKDRNKGWQLIEKSAELEYIPALLRLADHYQGKGMTYDDSGALQQSIDLYRKIVEKTGDPEIMGLIACLYKFANQSYDSEYWYDLVYQINPDITQYGDKTYQKSEIEKFKSQALEELKSLNPKKYMSKGEYNTVKALNGLLKGMEFLGIGK